MNIKWVGLGGLATVFIILQVFLTTTGNLDLSRESRPVCINDKNYNFKIGIPLPTARRTPSYEYTNILCREYGGGMATGKRGNGDSPTTARKLTIR